MEVLGNGGGMAFDLNNADRISPVYNNAHNLPLFSPSNFAEKKTEIDPEENSGSKVDPEISSDFDDHADDKRDYESNCVPKDENNCVSKDGNENSKEENVDSESNADDAKEELSEDKNEDVESGVEMKNRVRELTRSVSSLNPFADEFVPKNLDAKDLVVSIPNNNSFNRRRKFYNNQGRRRLSNRTSRAQREDSIRRTVYVSDIDQQVTEEQLATLFQNCGQVVDCRICGDPNSHLRFAFVEFTDENSARFALSLAGTILGFYPLRVLPSKTAIAPVNPSFLPRTNEERELCARTVYCTNIDRRITHQQLKEFFENLCGKVSRVRLLGDYQHSTRIGFVEFMMAESAMSALQCSGQQLGSTAIRVSPSKTPVRLRSPRPSSR